jgi:RNA polymerase sigma-70 factor (ECF subfamily)
MNRPRREDPAEEPMGPREFATTHWSLVVAASAADPGQTRTVRALEELCRAYWYPIYAFVRHRGHSAEDAQDVTQAFFTRILETRGLAAADPNRGRFRSYLLGAVKHFLANEWHRAQAQKRGGRVTFLEWDALDPESRYALEPRRNPDCDADFDREWAQDLTSRALLQLRSELESRGKGPLFAALKGSLTGEETSEAPVAVELGMSEGAVKQAVHRLRKRYRELVRSEIAATVADLSEIDVEMRHLVDALRKKS